MCRSAGADTLVARYGLMVGSPSGVVAWGRGLGRVRHAQERPGPGRCGAVRGTYDQRRLRRGSRADDLDRPTHRPVRRHGGASPFHQRAARLDNEPQRMLSARVACSDGGGQDRRARPERLNLLPLGKWRSSSSPTASKQPLHREEGLAIEAGHNTPPPLPAQVYGEIATPEVRLIRLLGT